MIKRSRSEILSQLGSIHWLKHAAIEFDKAWRDAYLPKEKAALSQIELKAFLSPSTVLSERSNRRLAGALPGILVALGILGTFAGLVYSLPRVGTFEVGQDATELRDLVVAITSGLGLAFYTSILGISLSVLFLVFDRYAVNKLERAVVDLSDAVKPAYPSLTEGERSRIYHEHLSQIRDNIDTLAMDMATSLTAAIEPAFDKVFAAHMAPAMEAMQSAVEQLVQFSSERQVEGVEKIVGHFLRSMNEALGDQFKELQNVLDTAVQSQRSIGDSLREFSGELREAAEVQRDLIEQTTRAGETLKSSLNRLEVISHTLGEAADKIVDAGAQLEKSASMAGEAHRIAKEAQAQLLEAAEKHSQSMEQARVSLEEAWRAATEQARGAIHQIQQATRELSEGISDKLLVALQSFDGALGETIERFSGTLSQVDGSVSELPGAAEEMRATTEELAQCSKQLLDSLNTAQNLFSEMRQTTEQLRDNIGPVNESLDRLCTGLDDGNQLTRILGQLQAMTSNLQRIENVLKESQVSAKKFWPFGGKS